MNLLSIKDKLIDVTQNINSETTFDELIERMFLIYKIEKGILQVNEGKVISHSDLKAQVVGWKR
jgi:hypothetical protein